MSSLLLISEIIKIINNLLTIIAELVFACKKRIPLERNPRPEYYMVPKLVKVTL